MEKSFLKPKCIEHEVNEELLKFYPVSLGVIFQLKEVLKPLAFGLASIFTDKGSDRGYTSTSDKDGFEQTIVNPIGVDLARLRAEEKQKAILDFLEAFSDIKSRNAMGRLVMDSLREEFGRRLEHKDVTDFIESVDADSLVQLLTGVVRANKGVFGPFGDMIGKMFSKNIERMKNQTEMEMEMETETAEKKNSPVDHSLMTKITGEESALS